MMEFISKKTFDEHLKNCMRDMKSKCIHCEMTFDNVELLTLHMKENHMVRMNFFNIMKLFTNIKYFNKP